MREAGFVKFIGDIHENPRMLLLRLNTRNVSNKHFCHKAVTNNISFPIIKRHNNQALQAVAAYIEHSVSCPVIIIILSQLLVN